MTAELSGIEISCPVPRASFDRVATAHGGGGRLARELLERVVLPALGAVAPAELLDAAPLARTSGALAMTTDAFVVRPIFFPGGDIGELAVRGSINDLAVAAARPIALSLALILEEGLPVEDLRRAMEGVRRAASEIAGLRVVCGDTKVVERPREGEPGLTIATTAIGETIVPPDRVPHPKRVRPGDVVLVSGTIGEHGMAVMSAREGLEFDSPIVSDCAALWPLVERLLAAADARCTRDPTRGGLASALVEIATEARVRVEIEERAVPVSRDVRAACEIFGLDPMHVACEGRLVAFVAEAEAAAALDALRSHPLGGNAAVVGRVVESARPDVVVRTAFGGLRPLDMLSGEQLPRIC